MSESIATLVAGWNRAAVREAKILGVSFKVRGIPTADRVSFVASVRAAKDDPNSLEDEWPDERIVALGLCGEDGELLGATPADLAAMDSGLLSKLAAAILKASGIGHDEAEDAEKK